MSCWKLFLCLSSVLCAVFPAFADEPPSPAAVEFFETKVRPLLVEHCQECHCEKKQRGGLRLDTREFLLKGTDNGPGLVPGKPDESRILHAVKYTDEELKMP